MDELMVSVSQIEKILKKSKEIGAEEVSFSFIIGSLFPEAYQNIKKRLMEERIAGYNEAKKEFERGKNENQRLN